MGSTGSMRTDESDAALADLFEDGATAGHGNSDDDGTDAPRKPRRTLRKVVLGLVGCLGVLLLVAVGALAYVQHHLNSNVDRIDGVFAGLDHRPARATGAAADSMNILLLGTDRRSDVATTGSDAQASDWIPGQQRSDTIMILHLDADRRGASLVSIPRDTWVNVPGYGQNKINAAFSFAGPSLAVQTVEDFTGIHIDHLAVVDWDGYAALIDAVGGVDVNIPITVHDSARDITWKAGTHHLDGQQALDYVGQRYGLPNGDLDRVARQQAVLRTLSQQVMSDGVLSSPKGAYDLVDTFTQHLSVDSDWSGTDMAKLALSLRHVRAHDVTYMTMPVAGFGDESGQSVVYADDKTADELWRDMRDDQVREFVANHPTDTTGSLVY